MREPGPGALSLFRSGLNLKIAALSLLLAAVLTGSGLS
jgi:hypothetical protein